MDDDKIISIYVESIEKAFAGNKHDDIVTLWLRDKSGETYSLVLNRQIAKDLGATLKRAFSALRRDIPLH